MQSDNFNKYFEKLNELCEMNDVDFIEYYEDMNEMRETKELVMKNEEFRKTFKKILNRFCLSNGLYYRLDKQYLDDEEKTFLSLITHSNYQPQNRFRQAILNYYYANMNLPMKEVNLENLGCDFCKNYYNGKPGLSSGLKKTEVKVPELGNCSLNLNMGDLINYGSMFQFDVDGFPRNQYLYLLFGLCIYDVIHTEHKTFKELVKHITSFVQLNLLSKCFDGEIFTETETPFNLITFIDFKEGSGLNPAAAGSTVRPNRRYQVAKNYVKKDVEFKGKTKLNDDDKGLYILTEYTHTQIKKLWEELEQLYANKDYDALINKWFDSQCLTRSTCLVGCMLISILKNKIIRFKKDEMPDWKSILTGDYKDTFDELADIVKNPDYKPLTLNDVLFVLKIYTSMIGCVVPQ